MDEIISRYLSSFKFEGIKSFKNMAVVPIFSSLNDCPEYLTLKEALEKNFITITEIDNHGFVLELRAVNNAEIPVLLIDGEELEGAKQNRVLNTSILLQEKSETIIPVSCVEQGRWSYISDRFYESGIMAAAKIRRTTSSSVYQFLNIDGKHISDQRSVWQGINELSIKAGVHSLTNAMKDVFDSKVNEINEYLKVFKVLPHQKGLLVFLNGKVAGLDFVSLTSAYEKLHTKLIKSYAIDALLYKTEKLDSPALGKVKQFIKEAGISNEKIFDSIGYGFDYRFSEKNILGTALVYSDKVIHMVFFSTNDSEKVGQMPIYRQIKGFKNEKQ